MSSRGTRSEDDAPLDADAAFALLPRVLDAIVDAPWWSCSDAVLVERVEALGVAESRVAAAQVEAVAEGMRRGLPERVGAKTGGVWLRSLVPVTPYVARQRAALAVDLAQEGLAPTREAFAAGRMAAGHAAAITQAMAALDRVPEVDAATWSDAQALLVEEAARLDPAQLGRAGLAVRNRLDPRAAERLARDEDAQEQARQLLLVQERTGMWLLRGLLPPLAGAALQAALDPLGAPRPGSDGTPDPRTATQRRADALTVLAQTTLTARGDQPNRLPERHGSPVRVVVTADLATALASPAALADQTSPAGHRALAGLELAQLLTDDGPWELSPLSLQVALCDAEAVPVLTDGLGRALDVGQSQYRFPKRIRQAIEVRDAHCTFPGCQAPPAWCHTHHLVPFSRNGRPGGPTSEANGTLLCGRHHRHVHATGWTGRLVEGVVHWSPPRTSAQIAGDPIATGDAAQHGRHAAGQRELAAKLRHLARQWLTRNPHLRPPPLDTS